MFYFQSWKIFVFSWLNLEIISAFFLNLFLFIFNFILFLNFT